MTSTVVLNNTLQESLTSRAPNPNVVNYLTKFGLKSESNLVLFNQI